MAQSSVDLIVNAVKAINPLRAVAAASKKAEVAINSLKRAAKDTGDKLADMGRKGKKGLADLARKAGQAAGKFGKLGKAALLAAGAAGAAALLKFSFGKAGELERQTKSLQVLTGSLETAKGIISELQAFGAVTPFTSTELIETSKRLKAFGFETEQVVDITKRLADVAGATGADLSGIATAFGQIQAKGRLQGEELLQLQERGVALQDELRKMYGLTGTEFSKALEKGQISAKAAEVALIRLTEAGGKYANGAVAQSDTLFGKLSTLQDALQRFGQNIGKVLSPIFKGIINFLTTITNQINNLFREAEIARKVDEELGISGKGSAKRFAGGRTVAERREFFERRQARIEELRNSDFLRTPETPDMTIPELLQGRAGTGGKDPAEEAAQIAQASADRVRSLEQATLLASALTDEERKQFERQIQIADILENKRGLTEDQIKAELEATTALFEQQDATEAITKANELRLKQDEALKKKLDEQKQKAEELDNAFRTGIVDALTAAIEGTKSLGDSLLGVIKSMAKLILQQKLLNALKGFSFTGFLGFADGGRPPVGRPSIVGERGPELFVPDRAGTIIPNNQLGGGGAAMASNVVVNVDASGTTVEGNEGQSRQLGALIGAAVQTELIKQQRPGGLLSR